MPIIPTEFSTCAECGMPVITGEYHPYTACVLYRQTHQSDKVVSMLREVVLYGYEAAKKGISVDVALRNIAASNTRLQADASPKSRVKNKIRSGSRR